MAEDKRPTIKRTLLGYEKESRKSSGCAKGRQENNRLS